MNALRDLTACWRGAVRGLSRIAPADVELPQACLDRMVCGVPLAEPSRLDEERETGSASRPANGAIHSGRPAAAPEA